MARENDNIRFSSQMILDEVISNILDFYENHLQPVGIEDYSLFLDYKKNQVYNLLEGRYDITPEELMMYMSCPLNVEKKEDITNFGLRTLTFPHNGKINMYLSDELLKESIMDSLDDTDDVIDDRFVTLPNKEDQLRFYCKGMLNNISLQYHLFLTGRGDEFTKLYGDTDFLKRMEEGKFTEEDIMNKIPVYKSLNEEYDSDFRRLYAEDLKIIKSKLEEKRDTKTNIMVKGA